MAIIKIGDIFKSKFQGNEEPRVEVALGGLPVAYSVLKPHRTINADDRYKLNLQLNAEQYQEIHDTLLEALEQLNIAGNYGVKKPKLKELLARSVGESTREEGVYRFYGSKKMGYADRDSGEMVPASLPVYIGAVDNENLCEKGILLGSGSIVRSKFIVSLFKKDGQVMLNINPSAVVVIKKVDVPQRETLSHDGLDDTDSYDY